MQLRLLVHKICHWETWDWRLKYIPILPVWIWNCIRARSWWWFTPSNPKLKFGGFEGVTKMSIYKHLPPESYPLTVSVSPDLSVSELEKVVSTNFLYPFVVKPDVGRMGFMFRIISKADELFAYHAAMCVDYVLQQLVTYPLELSVFYYRFPNAATGTITGFVRKEFLKVCGDGVSSIEVLMQLSPRTECRLGEMRARHGERLKTVLKKDETFCLSHALNLSRGCSLISLENQKDGGLLKVFDDISSYSDTLYYGRFDIKCASIEELKHAKNFSIIEYNGSGAEPHHVYGNGNSLLKACRILADHRLILSDISRFNHSRGVQYDGFVKGWKTMRKCRKHFAHLRKLDATFPEF